MDAFREFIGNQYFIPLIPAFAVLIDYILTFLLADNKAMILQYESSPLLKFATANDLLFLYLTGIMLFYYFTAFFVLRLLHYSPVYPIGVALIGIVSLTHIFGGLSWYFRNSLYSNLIFSISIGLILVAIILFGYVAVRHPCDNPGISEKRIQGKK